MPNYNPLVCAGDGKYDWMASLFQVRSLEQQNKVLATKWELLQQCVQPTRKNLEAYFENFICNLKKQLECLLSERGKLEHEQKCMQELVEDYRTK